MRMQQQQRQAEECDKEAELIQNRPAVATLLTASAGVGKSEARAAPAAAFQPASSAPLAAADLDAWKRIA